jgi:hypothetical protein
MYVERQQRISELVDLVFLSQFGGWVSGRRLFALAFAAALYLLRCQ